MPDQRFDFHGALGTVLSGRIERPQTTPRGWAIFAHCFTCGKESLAAARIARALALNGIGVLRFDFAGLGGSEGEFADSTFAADVGDCSGLMKPDTHLGENARHIEVSDDQATSCLFR